MAAHQLIAEPSAEELRKPDWIDEGQKTFAATCAAYCHGSRGDSGIVKPFTERRDWNPKYIHDVIVAGRVRGSRRMPAWGETFSDEDVWKLVAYIKSLSADFPGKL